MCSGGTVFSPAKLVFIFAIVSCAISPSNNYPITSFNNQELHACEYLQKVKQGQNPGYVAIKRNKHIADFHAKIARECSDEDLLGSVDENCMNRLVDEFERQWQCRHQ